ncbi:MAG: hypothetical protein E7627_06960 [Ruminococcaceae bacterium]|nr:hypothetical protein [Oscillospiraceae bacterium]
MDSVFLKLINMSVTATWFALAVILLRLLLKKAPRWITVAMWALVGVRLVCPISFESMLSLVPSAETVPADIVYAQTPEIHSGVYIINSVVNPVMSESFTPTPGASVNPIQIFLFLAEIIWIAGMIGMVIYTLVSYLLLHRKVREAVPYKDNVWLCDRISSPFILGIIRPRIYLPSDMAEADMEYVLAHERAHITRRDHWWKPLGFLLLTVYWFNPVMWIAYILLCRDIELACDEKVLTSLGTEIKKPYSDALINCSVPRRSIAACPLAFGEVGVKTRIKSVLDYKKPAFWVIVVALVLCVALAVGFLTDPVKNLTDERLEAFIDVQIYDHHETTQSGDNYRCMDYTILGEDKRGDEITVYMWVLYEEYSLGPDGELINETGAHTITAITAKEVADYYELVEYWTPRDGNLYAKDIMDKIPPRLWGEATDPQRYIGKQKAKTEEMAREYFASQPDTPETDGYLEYVPQYLKDLQENYPEYFGLDTTKGLEVYWYQMAAGNYNWVVLPGRDEEYTWKDIVDKIATTTGEMRAIVDSYGLPRNQVSVKHLGVPHSSYIVPYSQEYYSAVVGMFWNTVPMIDTKLVVPTYGSLVFDIDKDGLDEVVTLGMGRTSGVFSFSISASYNGEQKYTDSYIAPYSAPQFYVRSEDEVRLLLKAQAEKGKPEVTVLYEINAVNGHIMLTPEGGAEDPFKIRSLLWQADPTKMPFNGYYQVDIDDDGVGELAWIEYDYSSSIYSIVVRDDVELEYRNTFNANSRFPKMTLFDKLGGGTKVCLELTPRNAGDSPIYYDISIEDGEIVLTEINVTE